LTIEPVASGKKGKGKKKGKKKKKAKLEPGARQTSSLSSSHSEQNALFASSTPSESTEKDSQTCELEDALILQE
jgi:hypothetical protein